MAGTRRSPAATRRGRPRRFLDSAGERNRRRRTCARACAPGGSPRRRWRRSWRPPGSGPRPAPCWSRSRRSSAGRGATTSGAVSLNLIIYGLTAPFAAALMERFGIRRVVAARAGDGLAGRRADHGDDRGVAAVVPLGRAGRRRHRRDGPGVRGDRGEPVVRPAPRPGHRDLLGGELHRPADLPAADRPAGQRPGLALGGRCWWRCSRCCSCPWCCWCCATGPSDVGEVPYGAPASYVEPPVDRSGPGAATVALTHPARGEPALDLLGAVPDLLDLRLVDQRPDRHPLHPRRPRPRHAGRRPRPGCSR